MVSKRWRVHRSDDGGDSHPRRLLGCFRGPEDCFREIDPRKGERGERGLPVGGHTDRKRLSEQQPAAGSTAARVSIKKFLSLALRG
ncbi:hypothetical protein V6N11_018865 [Hibiscus sabdariffa]|uniref:Uncharacterized protein n=2 Tax=Hibiscus sabdariffa TaxID=183260 RepID=A0ABR2N6J8_9ROSI